MAYVDRYVSDSDQGLADGSSPANCWGWSTMLTSAAAGDRCIVFGTVRRSSISNFTNSGTSSNPILIVGAVDNNGTLAGPNDIKRHHGFGKLDTSNMVGVIQYTSGYLQVNKQYIIFEDLWIWSATTENGTMHFSAGSGFNKVTRCIIENASASGSGECSRISTAAVVFCNCDILLSGANNGHGLNSTSHELQVVGCFIDCYGSANAHCIDFAGSAAVAVNNILCNAEEAVVSRIGTSPTIVANNCIYHMDNRAIWIDSDHDEGLLVFGNVCWDVDVFIECFTNTNLITVFGNCVGNIGTSLIANPGPYEVTAHTELTEDPFMDAANNYYALNNRVGGGSLVRLARSQHGMLTMPGCVHDPMFMRQTRGVYL